LLEGYRAKRDSDRAMLERMVFYGQTGRCRWKVLLDHFGEGAGFEACGSCDNCLRIAEQPAPVAAQRVEAAESTSPSPAPFAPGDRVRVRRYGLGEVDCVGAEGVTVRFDEGVTRLFLAAFVRAARPARSRSRKDLPSDQCAMA
jgi:ATP-dependent DNA helicase RecQ